MKTPREPSTHEMRNGDDDLTALYRKAPRPEPDTAIDDAILRAARNAAAHGRGRVARPFSTRWQVPASIAAVILITVVLVPALYQHADPELETVPTVTRPAVPTGGEGFGSDVGSANETAPIEVPASPAPMMPAPPPQTSTLAQPSESRAQSRQSYGAAGESAISRELGLPPATDDDFDVMLERIRKLLEDGDRDAAQREFTRLRLRYPDAVVDPELMQQLHDR